MVFFHVNLESYNGNNSFLSYSAYTILLTGSFFLIWLDYPSSVSKRTKSLFVGLGILLLALLAYLYVGGSNEHPEGLKPHWWGILGLIGWAYLVTAFVYLFSSGNLITLTLAFLAFAAINVCTHLGLIQTHLWVIGDASSITLMAGGALISGFYNRVLSKGNKIDLWITLAFFGLISIAFGFFIRPYAGGISKIYATPAWVFICMGITTLIFELIIYLIELKGKKNYFKPIKPAGTSTLTCYLIPYLLYAAFGLVHFQFPAFLSNGILGIIRSIFIAFLVTAVVWFLEKKKLRLKV